MTKFAHYFHNISLVAIVLLVTNGHTSAPNFVISTSTVYPRLNLVNDKESSPWRVWIGYNQNFKQTFQTEGYFEYGSVKYGPENGYYDNSFRILSLTTQYYTGKHILKFGRINYWSNMFQSRIDGFEYTYKLKQFGDFQVLLGFPSNVDFDYDKESFGENKFLLTSWSHKKKNSVVQITQWMISDNEETKSYIGSSLNSVVFKKIRISSFIVWSTGSNNVYSAHVKFTRDLGRHTVSLSLRQKRYFINNPYPWYTGTVRPSPNLTTRIRSRLSNNTMLLNQFTVVPKEEITGLLKSVIQYKNFQTSVSVAVYEDRKILGGGIGSTKSITKSLSIGGMTSLNELVYDTIPNIKSSKNLYGWILWKPKPRTIFKLFGSFRSNPYYNVDGRIGLVINVVI